MPSNRHNLSEYIAFNHISCLPTFSIFLASCSLFSYSGNAASSETAQWNVTSCNSSQRFWQETNVVIFSKTHVPVLVEIQEPFIQFKEWQDYLYEWSFFFMFKHKRESPSIYLRSKRCKDVQQVQIITLIELKWCLLVPLKWICMSLSCSSILGPFTTSFVLSRISYSYITV